MFDSSHISKLLFDLNLRFKCTKVKSNFDNFSTFSDALIGSVVWCRNKNLSLSQASIFITGSDQYELFCDLNRTVFFVDNPRLVYAEILRFFSKDSFIENDKLRSEVDQSYISNSAIIYENVRIGFNVKIHHNVVIYPNVIIGNNVEIFSGAIIGSSGFGYEKNDSDKYVSFPKIGRVIIESNVDIGANTCIDRGSLGNTIICDGVKISNHCQIAHNVTISSNTLVAGMALIGGSSFIGEGCYIGPGAKISNKLHIGKNSTIKIGSIVTCDITEGDSVSGYFAFNHTKNIMLQARLKRSKK